eukprot:3677639-Prymnesium_polylepis.1
MPHLHPPPQHEHVSMHWDGSLTVKCRGVARRCRCAVVSGGAWSGCNTRPSSDVAIVNLGRRPYGLSCNVRFPLSYTALHRSRRLAERFAPPCACRARSKAREKSQT